MPRGDPRPVLVGARMSTSKFCWLRDGGIVVCSLHQLGAVQSAIRSGSSDHGGQIDCAREARWWSEGHSDRFFRATFGGENSGEAIHQGVRIGMRSIPIRSVHKSRYSIGHMVRATTDNDPSLTLLSVDGIGAYDHIFRSSMLGRLLEMPRARALLPFVRMSYAQPSQYSWVDEEGRHRIINQAEGGEQGDPLMPLLFSIGIQQALEEVAAAMVPGEQLSAFLDDIYLLCQLARVKLLFKLLERALLRCAGIELHQGKTKTWNRARVVPDNIGEVGDDAWQPEGITVLGTPVGSEQYISRKMEERITKERELWSTIPTVPDLQCSWQLLLQSANPRANHTMRTMPPSQSSV